MVEVHLTCSLPTTSIYQSKLKVLLIWKWTVVVRFCSVTQWKKDILRKTLIPFLAESSMTSLDSECNAVAEDGSLRIKRTFDLWIERARPTPSLCFPSSCWANLALGKKTHRRCSTNIKLFVWMIFFNGWLAVSGNTSKRQKNNNKCTFFWHANHFNTNTRPAYVGMEPFQCSGFISTN